MRRFASQIASRAGALCLHLARALYQSPMERRVVPWRRDDGDRTLRLDYDLDEDSLVFDLGGYEGQWASDLFAKYCCRIEIFEPVPEFAERIAARFRKNRKIAVHRFALAGENGRGRLALAGDRSSLHLRGGHEREIVLVEAAAFLRERGIGRIDLMKINIEGGEYDLLDHLIGSGLVRGLGNLQVQFHDFVPEAGRRMEGLQARLRETHALTYQYPFVWENWRLNDDR